MPHEHLCGKTAPYLPRIFRCGTCASRPTFEARRTVFAVKRQPKCPRSIQPETVTYISRLLLLAAFAKNFHLGLELINLQNMTECSSKINVA